MSFETTYQLISPISDSPEALSYKAIMKMTGEEVWIHIVRTDAQDIFELALRQHAASSFGEKPILEVVQEGAKAYIVTRPLPPGATLRDWLRSLGQAKTPDPMQTAGAFKYEGFTNQPPPPPEMATQQMPVFKPPPLSPLAPPPLPPVAPPPKQESVVAAVMPAPVEATRQQIPPPTQEPGSFTQMFKAAPAAPPLPPITPTVPPPAAQAPGEFTQMFRASSTAPQSTAQMPNYVPPPPPGPAPLFPPPPAAAAANDDGEFARMFQSPLIQHTPAPINPITNPIAPPPSQKEGEFTRMFKSVQPSADLPSATPPTPPKPPAAGPGDFTRLLQTPNFGGGMAPANPAQAPTPFSPTSPVAATNYPNPSQAAHPTQPPPTAASSGGGIPTPGLRKPTINGPSFSAPSASMPGMSGPSISNSGQISAPHMGTPSFNQGHMNAPSVGGAGLNAPVMPSRSIGGGNFSLNNLPGFGPGASPSAAPDVAPPSAGPLSSANAPMNPNALSAGDGATGFFKTPAGPQPSSFGSPAPPMEAGPGEFTRMMKAPPVASAPAVGVPLPQSKAPATNSAPIFSQPVAPATAPSAAPTAAPAPAPKPAGPMGFLKGISPWVIIGNVVIILMVIVLIYVIMKSSR